MNINDTKPMTDGFHHAFKIEHKYHAPACPGVYFLIEQNLDVFNVLYIGCSRWVRGRVISHPVINKLKKKGVYVDIWIIPLNEKNYKAVEIIMIDYFRPAYNKKIVNVGVAYKMEVL